MASTTSILEALTRALGPAAFSKAAAAYGESEPGVTKAFTVAVASALAPLVARAGEPQFTRHLLSAVRDIPADVTLLDEPDRLFNRAPRAMEETGPVAMLRSLVFGGNTQTITGAISRASGVKEASAASLFSIALPTVLGYLSRIVARENLDAEGLGRRLAAERTPIAAVLPANLGSLLSLGTDPAALGARAAPVVRSGAAGTAPTRAPARSSSAPWVAAALLALAALVGVYGYYARSGRTGGTPGAVGTAGYLSRVLPDGTNVRIPAGSAEAMLLSSLEGAAPAGRDSWYELERVTFETDSATLQPRSTEQLSNVAAILAAYPGARIKVGGYTDNSGDNAANQQLSQARAAAVSRALAGLGVAANRLEAEGYGSAHPVADNNTPEGRARNRRVAIRVLSR
jgi:outer membrane protein OmpA-like peptidoglycan-associated protein